MNNLIPKVTTEDLDPKEPWEAERRKAEAEAAGRAAAEAEAVKAEEDKKKKEERSLWAKGALAFVIVAAIVGLGILLPLKLVPGASSLISSVFNREPEPVATTTPEAASVEFTAEPASIQNGSSTKIAWTGPVRRDGVYSLSYPCIEGAKVTLLAGDGTTSDIACGQNFQFLSIDNTMTLSMVTEKDRVSEIPLSFTYTDATGTKTELGNLNIAVTNPNLSSGNSGLATNQGAQPSSGGNQGKIFPTGENVNGGQLNGTGSTIQAGGTNTVFDPAGASPGTASSGGQAGVTNSSAVYNSAPRPAAQYYGRPDLVIRIIAAGKIDPATNQLYNVSSYSPEDRIGIQFVVVNEGTAPSGAWRFKAQLPTVDSKMFDSGVEPSLLPGGRIVFNLAFTGIRGAAENVVLIGVDADQAVAESNESNNLGTLRFPGSGDATSGVDLKAQLVGIGTIENGRFVNTNRVYEGDTIAVQFRVTNVGAIASGAWKFKAVMEGDSSDDEYSYMSNGFYGFQPGQSAVYTALFQNVEGDGTREFEITVDPSQDTADTRFSNNRIRTSIEVR